jgi:WD40 repeat protein
MTTMRTSTIVALTLGMATRGIGAEPKLEVILPISHAPIVAALSSDGKFMVTGAQNGAAVLWDTSAGKGVRMFEGHEKAIRGVALTADAKQILTGSLDTMAILWDSETGKQLQTFQHTGQVLSVALTADGKRVATHTRDEISLWDAATGKKRQSLKDKRFQSFESMAMAPDGRRLVTASSDKTATLWDLATGNALQTFTGHKGFVKGVAISADGKVLAPAASDKTAMLWDAATGKALHTLRTNAETTKTRVILSANGSFVLTGSERTTSSLWDVATGKRLQIFKGSAMALSADGTQVFIGSGLVGGAALLDVATGKDLHSFKTPASLTRSIAISGDGTRMCTGSSSFQTLFWDTQTGKKLHTFDSTNVRAASSPDVRGAVALSFDGKFAITEGGDKSAMLWDTIKGTKSQTFLGHAGRITSVALSRDWETSRHWICRRHAHAVGFRHRQEPQEFQNGTTGGICWVVERRETSPRGLERWQNTHVGRDDGQPASNLGGPHEVGK